jgi:outer membrane biosynthesis protein TonB
LDYLMNDVIAPEAPPKINFTELNVRQEQGKPHFVRLNDSVVKRLERQLIDKPPVMGSERFGLLLGSIQTGDQWTATVEDFEPAARLEELIGSWKPGAGSQQRIVGYYRSHRQADFAPDQSDRALYERCFPKGSRVALLVKPSAGGVGTAMFFVGENGQLGADRATVEFPFNLRELGAEEAPTPAPAIAPVPVPKPAVLAASKPVPVAAATKLVPVSSPEPTSKPVTIAAPISTPQPASVEAAPPARKEQPVRGGAMLKIAVAGGVAIVSFFGLSELPVFKGLEPAAPPAKTAASATPAESRPAVEAPATQPQPEPKTQEAPEPPPLRAAAETVKPSELPVKQPKSNLDKVRAKALVVPVPAPALPTLIAQNTIPSPAAVPQPRPQALPVLPAGLIPASIPAPSPTTPAASVPVTPPHAIRQFAPVLSEKVSRNIVGEAVVRLKVSVNAAGKVTGAEPIAGGSPVPDVIVATAVNTVKRWQFEPARRGDDKVAGEVVLSFIFRK